MGLITLTVSTIDGVAPANSLQMLESDRIISMTGAGNSASGAATIIVEGSQGRSQGAVPTREVWVVTETAAAVKALAIASEQQSAFGAKIPAGALVAGVRTITDANVTTSSVATIAKRALGGTYAPGYKVVCTTDTVTITALKVDGTTTETANTDSVMGYIVY